MTESGRVPEIKVLNTGERPVLIIDGEELVGAKQNRTVNISLLIPPAADVIVPVTCVEAGRWNRQSRGFASSSRTHYAAGRAAKSAQVSESLRRKGVDLFDGPDTFRSLMPKILRGYALDAIDFSSDAVSHAASPPDTAAVTLTLARQFMQRVLEALVRRLRRRASGKHGASSRRRSQEVVSRSMGPWFTSLPSGARWFRTQVHARNPDRLREVETVARNACTKRQHASRA